MGVILETVQSFHSVDLWYVQASKQFNPITRKSLIIDLDLKRKDVRVGDLEYLHFFLCRLKFLNGLLIEK